LQSTQGEPRNGQYVPLAPHKHAIRRKFHAQLRELWRTNKFLKEHTVETEKSWLGQSIIPANAIGPPGWHSGEFSPRLPLSEAIADNFKENGYRWVPLVCQSFDLLCSLNILFLRRDFSYQQQELSGRGILIIELRP